MVAQATQHRSKKKLHERIGEHEKSPDLSCMAHILAREIHYQFGDNRNNDTEPRHVYEQRDEYETDGSIAFVEHYIRSGG